MENALNSWLVGQEVQLEVEKAILGGKFMGNASDGRVAWLKSAKDLAIGDLVTAKVLKLAKRSYELEVLSINQESSTHSPPFCPHIQQCGGCPWQALPIEQQIQSLSRDIDRMLSRAVGHEVKWLTPYQEDEQAWRHTARLHSDGKGRLGFYGPQGLLDLPHCPVFVPTLNQILEATRQLLPYLSEAPAEIRISVAQDQSSGTLALELHGIWSEEALQNLQKAIAELLPSANVIHGVSLLAHRQDLVLKAMPTRRAQHKSAKQNSARHKKSRKHNSKKRPKRSTPSLASTLQQYPEVYLTWGKAYNQLSTAAHPASAFMQAHQSGNQALVKQVIKGAEQAENILELYAGSGNFTRPLAKAKANRHILALEYDRSAVAALNQYAQQEQLNIMAQAQDIAQLPQDHFDHIILDPPRAGATPIIEALADSDTKYITYISCHPAALARDLESLCQKGWILEYAKLFHLFPHSGHAEVYCRLYKPHTSEI